MGLQGLPGLTAGELPAYRSELIITRYGSGTGYSYIRDGERVDGYLVITDAAAEELKAREQYVCGNYPAGAKLTAWETSLSNAVKARHEDKLSINTQTRHELYLDQLGAKVMVLVHRRVPGGDVSHHGGADPAHLRGLLPAHFFLQPPDRAGAVRNKKFKNFCPKFRNFSIFFHNIDIIPGYSKAVPIEAESGGAPARRGAAPQPP